jgi:hypothetical protein
MEKPIDISVAVHNHVTELCRMINAARESICEEALYSGEYGVLETRHQDGNYTFEVSSKVPYGEIHVIEVGY